MITIGSIVLGWVAVSWFSVHNIEEPKYTVVQKASQYEIRQYDGYIVAETVVQNIDNQRDAAGKGFRILADYIFGDNTTAVSLDMTRPVLVSAKSSEKMNMTAPVLIKSNKKQGHYIVAFVMPKKYTIDTLPKPNNKKVKIREVAPKKVAVSTFSWTSNNKAFIANKLKLLKALDKDGVAVIGSGGVARYNPPWTIPFMLRNEVFVEVK